MKYKRNQQKRAIAKQYGLPKEVNNLNFVQIMYLQKIARKMEKDMREQIKQEEGKFAMKFLIYVMINVMSGEGYWEKSYMKRIPKLFEDMGKLAEAKRTKRKFQRTCGSGVVFEPGMSFWR